MPENAEDFCLKFFYAVPGHLSEHNQTQFFTPIWHNLSPRMNIILLFRNGIFINTALGAFRRIFLPHGSSTACMNLYQELLIWDHIQNRPLKGEATQVLRLKIKSTVLPHQIMGKGPQYHSVNPACSWGTCLNLAQTYLFHFAISDFQFYKTMCIKAFIFP